MSAGEAEGPFLAPPMTKGTVPWSAEGLLDAFQYVGKLVEMPKDVWLLENVKRQGIDPNDEETGQVQHLALNPLSARSHLGEYLCEKHGSDDGLCHGYRFEMIRAFLADHLEELEREGLLERSGSETGVSRALAEALAILPYSGRAGPLPALSLAEVVAKAKELAGPRE